MDTSPPFPDVTDLMATLPDSDFPPLPTWTVYGQKAHDSCCSLVCEKCLARLEYDDDGPMIWDLAYDAKQLDCVKCGQSYRWTNASNGYNMFPDGDVVHRPEDQIEVIESRLARPTTDSAIKLDCIECSKSLVYWQPSFVAADDSLEVICVYCDKPTDIKSAASRKKRRVKKCYIHALPTELLNSIFNYLMIDTFAHNKPRPAHDLYHIALVCSRWREPAQVALFSTVYLSSNSQTGVWLDAPLELQGLVRHLGIDGGVDSGLGFAVIERRVEPEWVHPEKPWNGLRSFTVGRDYNAEMEPSAKYYWFHYVTQSHPIRSLAIEVPVGFPKKLPQPLELSHLERFSISDLDFDKGRSDRTYWPVLLSPARHSLKFLHLHCEEDGDRVAAERIVAAFAAMPFPNLVELVLEGFANVPLGHLLSCYPSLVSLTWNGEITDEQFIVGNKAVQPSVKHLTLGRKPTHWRDRDGRPRDRNFKEILKAIGRPVFKKLQVLTFQTPVPIIANWGGEDFRALLKECERRGIFVRCGPNHITLKMEPVPPNFSIHAWMYREAWMREASYL